MRRNGEERWKETVGRGEGKGNIEKKSAGKRGLWFEKTTEMTLSWGPGRIPGHARAMKDGICCREGTTSAKAGSDVRGMRVFMSF